MRWYNETSKLFMSRDYLKPGQNITDKIDEMSAYAEKILDKPGFANKFKEYVKNGWFIISSPTWTNFHGDTKASPISCFGTTMEDSLISIQNANSEIGMQNKIGGGTSGYFGNLRSRGRPISGGGISNGSVSFMEMFQTTAKIVSQANRRGHFSAYLPIEHSDFKEFIRSRTDGHPIQDLSFGVTITDEFMDKLYAEDPDSVERFRLLVQARFHTGFPYIFFHDTVNKNTVDVYKDNNLTIWHSNMCSEIALPNNELESFVCNIMGMNLEYFDEWVDTDAVEVAIYFMDAMLTDFINKNRNIPMLEKSVRFAERHRAMGLGASGYHTYLQSKMIPFESLQAKMLNIKIFSHLNKEAYKASEKMALEYGKPELLQSDKYNRRHTTLLAVAPNTSSSFIMGQQSQSIEPYVSNFYSKDVSKTKINIKNKFLEDLLEKMGKNTPSIWESIGINNGSVQHLEFLSEDEKSTFKTFSEISQYEVLLQASQRQQFIDQSQSLNLMIPINAKPADVAFLITKAHQLGIKTLYYQLNVNAAQQFTNTLTECVSCSG